VLVVVLLLFAMLSLSLSGRLRQCRAKADTRCTAWADCGELPRPVVTQLSVVDSMIVPGPEIRHFEIDHLRANAAQEIVSAFWVMSLSIAVSITCDLPARGHQTRGLLFACSVISLRPMPLEA
jgi:hypothetical protein